ncbi:MAG: hypothetical protein A2X36_07700 [Elusimicrobia bacterium GWA2_69_24]|nr:MAG: hypothetical protein A2X36_07700 [Elusimicrobia bacterium GWA2_69_24]HBL17680.1 hypothetical protein [Elusimicrobiota bacterium]
MRRDLQTSVFVRSMLLQSCWNFSGMQNAGFLYALDPVLRRAYPDPAALRTAERRHLCFFNTNPYMAGFVLGAVGAMEERSAGLPAAERPAAELRIEAVKKMMASSVAALGDALFWGGLKPFCAVAAMLAWLVLWTLETPHALAASAVLYLALYNAPALWLRWRGIAMGYSLQENLPAGFKGLRLQDRTRWIRAAGAAAAVLLVAALILVPPFGGTLGWSGFVVFGTAFGLRAARQVSMLRLYAGLAALGLAAELAGF